MTGYVGWTGTGGTVNWEHVFEHTADSPKELFKPGGVTGNRQQAAVR